MKKKIILYTLLSVFISLLITACGQEKDQELEDLINKLPSVQGDPFDSNSPSQKEDNISYISVIGKIISSSKDSFTIKLEEQEQKFYIDSATNIYGGEIELDQYVTVTYNESDKTEKKIYAFAITVLNDKSDVNGSEQTNGITTDDVTEDSSAAMEETTVPETTAGNIITTEATVQTTDEVTASEQTTPDTAAISESETAVTGA